MLKKIILLFSIAVAFIACQDIENSEKPENLIPEEKMVDIITEISLLQSARNFSKRIYESTGIKGQEYVFEKYNIDSIQFKRSNDYYADNYETYQRIYDSVKEGFERMKVKLDTLQKQEKHIEDSIAQAKKDSLKKVADSLDPELERELEGVSDSLIEEKDSLNITPIDSLPTPMSRN
ncbi:protein of unknown function [Salegentibacter holothuriorum]|uniref:DUF4296 domain-containing protein n=1 Tax=Salegentibacter holothuriorum TaxID=241145 RepID=A0A1T5C5A3_9FLAO|nr:DUF4296 domain-containing protein [Salegentibacter holothuriorum]SKB54529.1 protein of unknown function [Salegentibacter holothuriorum]